jgi:hypothetical protein
MTKTVYLAGSWEDRDEIHELMEIINQHPKFEINVDWTRHGWGNRRHMFNCAWEDKRGVMDCDVFVIHDPAKTSKGKYTELGMAITRNIPIITYKTAWKGIFSYLDKKIHVNTPDELLAMLDKVTEES